MLRMIENKNYLKLKEFALERGACLFGACRLDPAKESIDIKEDAIKGLKNAISVAVRLSDNILEEIIDHPTRLYFHHYRALNMFLDQLALAIQQFIQKEGYRALPIPASQILDWDKQSGHLSHKRFAFMSGLGWLGRNNLIVTPRYGARIRLTTVLTDMPLSEDEPLKDGCGQCRACVSACPAGSIKSENREEFDHIGCYEKLKSFRKNGYVEQFICGICVRACKGPSPYPSPRLPRVKTGQAGRGNFMIPSPHAKRGERNGNIMIPSPHAKRGERDRVRGMR